MNERPILLVDESAAVLRKHPLQLLPCPQLVCHQAERPLFVATVELLYHGPGLLSPFVRRRKVRIGEATNADEPCMYGRHLGEASRQHVSWGQTAAHVPRRSNRVLTVVRDDHDPAAAVPFDRPAAVPFDRPCVYDRRHGIRQRPRNKAVHDKFGMSNVLQQHWAGTVMWRFNDVTCDRFVRQPRDDVTPLDPTRYSHLGVVVSAVTSGSGAPRSKAVISCTWISAKCSRSA